MPRTSRRLLRHLIQPPLLLSLIPLLLTLGALEGPVRRRAEAMEADWCRERARMTAQLLIGVVRETRDGPIAAAPSGAERILTEDSGGRIIHDTASGRLQESHRWFGPGSEAEISLEEVRRIELPGSGPALRCRASWGSGERAGALIFLRPLRPLETGLAAARYGAALLWLLWAFGFVFLAARTQRRILAESSGLEARLSAFPSKAADAGPTTLPLLGLDRPVREAGDRTGEAIRHLEEELLERDAVLHGMLEGVVAVDLAGQVILINPSAERLLGLPAGSSQGRRVTELVPSSAFHDLIEQVLRDAEPGASEFDLAEGRRSIRVLGDALRGPDGAMRGAVLVMGDVTDIRRLEMIRRDFVANVSHELKTPITAIHGYVETLLEQGEDDPLLRRRFLGIVAENAVRMHRILEDLLQLARVESTGEEVERTPVDLRDLVARAIEGLRSEADAKGMRCESDLPQELPRLQANEALLERALENLIENAIKYGPNGSVVSVRARDEGETLRLEVKDSGPGIAAAHLPRLFERFYRVEKGRSRELGGTGLGLAIVRHIALAHGGEAGVESRLGEGSTFHIRIPWTRPGGIMGRGSARRS